MSSNHSLSSENESSFYQVAFGESFRIFPTSAEFLIGRGKHCSLRIPVIDVSRVHCEITCTRYGWKVRNMSPNGLKLNGQPIGSSTALTLCDSDTLVIGSICLQILVDVDVMRYRVPLRTLRFNELTGGGVCSLSAGNGLWERKLAELAEISVRNTRDNNLEFESESAGKESGSKENLERLTVIHTSGKGDWNLMDELIKVRQQNVQLARELEKTNEAYKNVVEERNTAVCTLKMLEKGGSCNLEDLLETEFQCSICHEVVVNATTTNCEHTFCEYCFLKWTKKNKACPVCRTSISRHIRTKMIDNCIEKLVSRVSTVYEERRKEIIETRKELTGALIETPRPRKKRRRSATTALHNGHQAITITLQNLGNLMDTTIDISSDDDSPVFLFQQRS